MEQQKKVLTGRFFRAPLVKFLNSLHEAAKQSRKASETERALRKIDYSLSHDFREGFKPREHGLDAHSIALRERARIDALLVENLRQIEAEQIKAQLDAVELLQVELTKRLQELDTQRGSVLFLQRQREILEARQRASA